MSRQAKPATFFALAFVAVLCISPVAAQPVPDDALRAARDLIAATRATDQMKLMLPTVMQESMSVGQAFGQRIAGELRSRMIEELRKKGHNI